MSLGVKRLEEIRDELYSNLDTDSSFSGLGQKKKDEIVNAELRRIEDCQSFLGRFATGEIVKNPSLLTTARVPVNTSMNLEFEPIKLQGDEYSEIEKAIKESLYSIESNDFCIDEKVVEMAAFRLIGKPYTALGYERERLFEDDLKLCEAYADAWAKADAVYNSDKKYFEALARKRGRILNHAHLAKQSQPGIEVPVEVPEVPEAPPKGPEVEEKKPSWFRRHPKLTASGIISLLGIAGTGIGYAVAVYMPKQQRIDQLVNSGAIPDRGRADAFDSRYNSWAINNVYNETVQSDFIPLWNQDSTLADDIGRYAIGPNHSVFRIARMVQSHPEMPLKEKIADTPQQWKYMVRLLNSVEDIDDCPPNLLAGGAVQVDNLLYKRGLAGSDRATEDRAWNEFAIPAIAFMIDGGFTGAGLTRDKTGAVLLPIELTEVRFYKDATGQLCVDEQPISYGSPIYRLGIGIDNVTPNVIFNGTSAQAFLRNLGNKILHEKGARYQVAIDRAYRAWTHGWPNSHDALRLKIDEVLETDPLAVALLGNMGIDAVRIDLNEEMKKPIIYIDETDVPPFKVLLARSMGRYAVQMSGYYGGARHDETAIQKIYGTMLGLWIDKTARDLDQDIISTVFYERLPDGNLIKLP